MFFFVNPDLRLDTYVALSDPGSRVFTHGDFNHIALNSPHLLKPWRFSCWNMECGEHGDYALALTLGISQKALMVQEKIKF